MKQVDIGIIGCGSMGQGLIYQTSIHPDINCLAVADLKVDKCTEFLDGLALPYEVVDSSAGMQRAIGNQRIAVTEYGDLITQNSSIGAVVEATNTVLEGGQYAVAALEHNKHLILMNSEIDLIFGPYLAWFAKRRKLICSSCDGDQYGVIKHLIDDLRSWGFALVMAGNIKGFLDRYATPASVILEADKRNLDYRMCASFTDGTKLNIEMAILANVCDLLVPVSGMYGPPADHVSEVLQKFDFDRLWYDREPFVDYILGAEPGGGVFAVGYCDHPYQQKMLDYYKMGEGPYYLFYRPYHLCHIEALSTVADAVIRNTAFMQPEHGFKANVYAYAKQNLKQGDKLDGVGGYSCYGLVENCTNQATQPGLPICLSENIVLKKDIEKDEKICIDDVFIPANRFDFTLYEKALRVSDEKTL